MQRKKRNNLSVGDFVIILTLVIGVGWLTLDQLLVMPNGTLLNGARLPASSSEGEIPNKNSSVGAETKKPANSVEGFDGKGNSTETIEFFCLAKRNAKIIKTQASQIRIFSKNCLNEKIIQVKNHTNGSTAVIFPVKQKEFTTDFFALVEGENHVEIKFKKRDGGDESITLILVR